MKSFLNDDALTEQLIKKEFRKGHGPRYIEMKLRSLGLSTENVRKSITLDMQKEMICKLKKSAASLQRRGFDLEAIYEVLSGNRSSWT